MLNTDEIFKVMLLKLRLQALKSWIKFYKFSCKILFSFCMNYFLKKNISYHIFLVLNLW